MSLYHPYVDPTFIYKRKGTEDDPFLFIKDTNFIRKGIFMLKEIPSFKDGFKVIDPNGNELIETDKHKLDINEYRVDYTIGVVYFHESRNGQEVTCEYYGTGYISISASRIWMYGESDDPIETLQEALSRVADGVRTLEEVGDLEFKGEYDPTAEYRKWNFVYYGGRTYVAIDDVTGENPNESDKWKLVSSGADFVGVYDPEKTYDILEMVADPNNKNIYISKIENNNHPLTDEEAWELMITLDDFLEQVEGVIEDLENFKQELEQAEQDREQNEVSRDQKLDDALEDLESFIQVIQAEDEVRNMNEEQRKSAETIRQSNEIGRQTQESIRVNNENQRQAAEEAREENVNTLIGNAQNTIDGLVESVDGIIEDFNNLKSNLLDLLNEYENISGQVRDSLEEIANFRYMGEYNPDATYYKNNIVTVDNYAFMALQEVTGIEPNINDETHEYWFPIAPGFKDGIQISIDGVYPDENGEIHLDQLDIVRQSTFDDFVDETNLKIGDLSNLRTARKDSIVDAINELKSRIDELIDLIS